MAVGGYGVWAFFLSLSLSTPNVVENEFIWKTDLSLKILKNDVQAVLTDSNIKKKCFYKWLLLVEVWFCRNAKKVLVKRNFRIIVYIPPTHKKKKDGVGKFPGSLSFFFLFFFFFLSQFLAFSWWLVVPNGHNFELTFIQPWNTCASQRP